MKYKTTLFDEKALGRAMIRIAHEISERNDRLDNVVLVGIKTRGVPFANRLAECIYTRIDNSVKIPVGTLDISAFRDDVDKNVRDRADAGEMPCDINGKTVILTDDVMCTGRTVRAALDALITFGRPAKIQLAVLVDRGHREVPIRADYVGKNIPTSHLESIKVGLSETDGSDFVEIYEKD